MGFPYLECYMLGYVGKCFWGGQNICWRAEQLHGYSLLSNGSERHKGRARSSVGAHTHMANVVKG